MERGVDTGLGGGTAGAGDTAGAGTGTGTGAEEVVKKYRIHVSAL